MFVRIKCTNRGEECLRERERKKKKERKVKRERNNLLVNHEKYQSVRIIQEISCEGYIIQIMQILKLQVDTLLKLSVKDNSITKITIFSLFSIRFPPFHVALVLRKCSRIISACIVSYLLHNLK